MSQLAGEDLSRIVGNTMKFVNPKSLYLPGELLFNLTANNLSCYACDDYNALTDVAELNTLFKSAEEAQEQTFVLKLEDVKDLDKFVRDNKKSDIAISFTEVDHGKTQVSFLVNDATKVTYTTLPLREDNWDVVDMILFEECPKLPFYELAFNPERFTKFSQLKHDKEAPMKWELLEMGTSEKSMPVVRFTLGNSIIGAIRPLILEENE